MIDQLVLEYAPLVLLVVGGFGGLVAVDELRERRRRRRPFDWAKDGGL